MARKRRRGSSRSQGYGSPKKENFGRGPSKLSRGLKRKIKARQQSGPKTVGV